MLHVYHIHADSFALQPEQPPWPEILADQQPLYVLFPTEDAVAVGHVTAHGDTTMLDDIGKPGSVLMLQIAKPSTVSVDQPKQICRSIQHLSLCYMQATAAGALLDRIMPGLC